MAETSGPWDGSGFAQDEWRELFAASWYDAVLLDDDAGTGDNALTATFSSSNRDVTMSPGKARVRGHLYVSDSDIIINVPAPSGSNQRIDYIALRCDPSEPVLDDRIKMVLIQGQEAADPSPPALTRELDGVWEWPRIRIGPYGTGPISGAPSQFMGTVNEPITVSFSNHNERIPGLPTVHNSMVIDVDGRLWRYNSNQDQYNRLGDPQTGTISPANGWAASSSRPPRWWLSSDGQVMLRGNIFRTGSSAEIPRLEGNGIVFTGNLPSTIRPPHSLRFSQVVRVRINSSGGALAYRSFDIHDGNPRFYITGDANPDVDWWITGNDPASNVSLDGMVWWVDV